MLVIAGLFRCLTIRLLSRIIDNIYLTFIVSIIIWINKKWSQNVLKTLIIWYNLDSNGNNKLENLIKVSSEINEEEMYMYILIANKYKKYNIVL